MSSGTSTEKVGRDAGLQPWHFYLLLSMAGATWAVLRAQDTQPIALLLISAAVLAAGGVATAVHYAVLGFLGATADDGALHRSTRHALEQEKALILRSIKELEFDHAMRKIGDADFAEIGGRLRARALSLMERLEAPEPQRVPAVVVAAPLAGTCPSCGVQNDADARFCKGCGGRLEDGRQEGGGKR